MQVIQIRKGDILVIQKGFTEPSSGQIIVKGPDGSQFAIAVIYVDNLDEIAVLRTEGAA